MALYRTKHEVVARYTEPWPADLIPAKTRDLSRRANFDKTWRARAPHGRPRGNRNALAGPAAARSFGRTPPAIRRRKNDRRRPSFPRFRRRDRGDAAAAALISRGDESRRRGHFVEASRGDAAAATRISPRRRRRGHEATLRRGPQVQSRRRRRGLGAASVGPRRLGPHGHGRPGDVSKAARGRAFGRAQTVRSAARIYASDTSRRPGWSLEAGRGAAAAARTVRGDGCGAAATWIAREGADRGRDVDSRRRVAAPPRLPRGQSAETTRRGDVAAATGEYSA